MSRLGEWKSKEDRFSFLRRTAKEVRNYKVRKKILLSALGGLLALTSLLFMASALHQDMGRLSVGVARDDIAKYGLTLSETRDMQYATSRLNAKINERITNISVNDLPENLSMIDGEHNGDNYIAYTFYLQNGGTETLEYEYEVTISDVSLGLDEAMRSRLYIEDEYVEYAKTRNDGTGAEPGTTEFYSLGIVTKGAVSDFAPKDKTKYTIVIWLEGDDPECVDRVIDGVSKVEMSFRVMKPQGK